MVARLLLGAACGALALLSAPALSWDGVGAAWVESPIPYWIADDLGPLDDAEASAAIHGAFATWAAVRCTSIRFDYRGRTTAPLLAADGQSSVALVASGWTGAAPSETRLQTDGTTILEGDIAVSLEDATWQLQGADGVATLDLGAALVAEVGHLIGLADSEVADATMNPALRGSPEGRSLSEDDIEGICTLYPAIEPGTGAIGSPCLGDESCAEDLTCVSDAVSAYCAPSCPTGQCPDGYACLEFAERQVCARGGCGCASAGDPVRVGLGAAPAWLLALALSRIRRSMRYSVERSRSLDR